MNLPHDAVFDRHKQQDCNHVLRNMHLCIFSGHFLIDSQTQHTFAFTE